MLLLPDGRQRLEVRLYERRRDDDTGEWLFLIGAPLWQYAGRGAVEPAEYRTWVTAKELEPIEGVDLSPVPTHQLGSGPPPVSRWGWILRPKPRGRGFTVHVHDCEQAAGGGAELGVEEALDAMLRPGAEACHRCDAAAVLIPMLQLGQGYA
ncbi:DUF6233 domain-containing protein [Streptomyces sp. NPDC048383]|uniref:DUF6233 domain-containing protein n=1 Tax=Streptomyces sp. NPDC048383 TaxID=3155386 RepID=UPI0034297958